MTATVKEMAHQMAIVRRVAEEVFREKGKGEIPRWGP